MNIRKNLKKIVVVAASLALLVSSLSGCSNPINNKEDSKKFKIIATIYPEYQWIKAIMGEQAKNADITTLITKGADLHSYQPSAMDIIKIKKSDLFVYVGGESDVWAKDLVKANKGLNNFNLLDELGSQAKEEEELEGMQEEEHEEHSDDEIEYDEHVWLSLKCSATLCEELEKKIEKMDPENKDVYKKNLDAYLAKLNKLDKEYEKTVSSAKNKTLIFGDRFPFKYLADDYNIKCYAAFAGCSAESEASFETITFLAKKVDELNLSNIMVIDNSDKKIAKTIISNTKKKNQGILSLNSMQSPNLLDSSNDYISIMEDNLEVLKSALK